MRKFIAAMMIGAGVAVLAGCDEFEIVAGYAGIPGFSYYDPGYTVVEYGYSEPVYYEEYYYDEYYYDPGYWYP